MQSQRRDTYSVLERNSVTQEMEHAHTANSDAKGKDYVLSSGTGVAEPESQAGGMDESNASRTESMAGLEMHEQGEWYIQHYQISHVSRI